ncbi:MAG TPA: T9SS type A sorting domain-containing protein [Bacteroidia bacterium]|nr:T9SS type A sorting domain-containing protein [Bacteroidia bacterium]
MLKTKTSNQKNKVPPVPLLSGSVSSGKKYFFVFLYCLLCNFLTAQIPGAMQQPKWSMALYFEEASGLKDTLYLGYDSVADYGHSLHDTIYNEKLIPVDTFDFHAKWYFPGCSTPPLCDSIYKVNISHLWFNYFPNTSISEIHFQNGNWPLRFSWDVSLFRSDSLPFPDQDPLPRAQGILYFAYSFCGVHENGNWLNCSSTNDNIVISDTASWFCRARDSITLLTAFGNPNTSLMNGYFTFKVEAWTGLLLGENTIIGNNNILIYPNPCAGIIKISNGFNPYEIFLYDVMGQEVKSVISKTKNTEIDLSALSRGIYFLKINSAKGEVVKKIILTK